MTLGFKKIFFVLPFSLSLFGLLSCSSPQPVKSQAYAKLNNQRTFENDFPTVWKAIEDTLRNFKVVERSPKDVDTLELKKLTHRTLETDWIFGQSHEKYHEYQINGSPRKVYLQTHFKYFLDVKSVIGGVTVTIKTEEEVERLNASGTPVGYSSAIMPDLSRSHELLEKINLSILSAAP
jgi:hypothetical protein